MRRATTFFLFTLCFVTSCRSHVRADTLRTRFASANQAYFRGEYAKAARAYETLELAGVADVAVYYNLATTFARLGRYGRAILYYERALRLDANDELVRRDLVRCQTLLARRYAEDSGEAEIATTDSALSAIFRPLSVNALAIALLVSVWAFAIAFLWRRWTSSEEVRLGLSISLTVLAMAAVVCAVGVFTKVGLWESGRPGVVLRDEVSVRDAPDPRARRLAHLREGQYVRVVRHDGSFMEVRLPEGVQGWIVGSAVGTF